MLGLAISLWYYASTLITRGKPKMDFEQAVIFVSAIIVIVASGVILGMVLKGATQKPDKTAIEHKKAAIYTEVVEVIDKIPKTGADERHRLAALYYAALIYSPDFVIKAFNHYVRVAAKAIDPYSEEMLNAKDGLILAMRVDIQEFLGARTRLGLNDFLSIEVREAAPIEKAEK